MSNLELWQKVAEVPKNAQKLIPAGRLKGMTDINPMWRIKTLTEQFGLCGIGWKYEITNKQIIKGSGEEQAAFVDINLYIKVDGEWSDPVQGTGGSMFITAEKNGLHTSDEAFKMALTDAISVACKALGIGANVYWNTSDSKYAGKPATQDTPHESPKNKAGKPTEKMLGYIYKLVADLVGYGYPEDYGATEIKKQFNKSSSKELTFEEASTLIESLKSDLEEAKARAEKGKKKFNEPPHADGGFMADDEELPF